MPLETCAAFLEVLRQHCLLPPDRVIVENAFPDAPALARELVQRGWLTPYQVNEIFLGRGPQLALGSYVLLDKLGEGGMGAVYKARHAKLDRIVALKVIRPQRLSNPTVVKRFQREIHAAAKLNHPNIVRAIDADEVAGTHFFVMEFVEGIDLSKLVKMQGPLPVAQACDFIRQAALGLQHAFERGLVHRDIKPHNLLLANVASRESGGANFGVVKILDMGLALVEAPRDSDKSSVMTQEGMVLGTPDYMAPEQTMDSHNVDIRTDLYSLGCTLYFLLAGKSPFAGLTLTEKLLRHQSHEAEPIEKRRPEVSAAVAAVVRKLMAKRPDERYQTPAALAQTLSALGGITSVPMQKADNPDSRTLVQEPSAANSAFMSLDGTSPVLKQFRQQQTKGGQRVHRGWLAAGATLVGVALLVTGWVLLSPRDRTEPPENGDLFKNKKTQVLLNPFAEKEKDKSAPPDVLTKPGLATDEWVKAVQALAAEEQAKAVFAKMKELNDGFKDPEANNTFTAKDGKVVALHSNQTVTDISPIRALQHLEVFGCHCPNPLISLADLSPLKGLPLKTLDLSGVRVEDLTPLTGMNLETLRLHNTWVRDLSPLKDMSHLRELNLNNSRVSDLRPLAGLKSLEKLSLVNTFVEDLRPLGGLNLSKLQLDNTDVRDLSHVPNTLTSLHVVGCPVKDLAALKKCSNLASLDIRGVPFESLEPLVGMKKLTGINLSFDYKLAPTLKRMPVLSGINHSAVAQFWKIVDPDPGQEKWTARVAALPTDQQILEVLKRMTELNPDNTGEPKFKQVGGAIVEVDLTNGAFPDLRFLAPLKKLERLHGGLTASLEPLRGLPIKSLRLAGYGIIDLSPLGGMPLENLGFAAAGVEEGEALRTVRSLKQFSAGYAGFYRVAPLAEIPLKHLETQAPRDLQTLKKTKTLEKINFPYDDFRHRDALKAMTWLKEINGKRPAEFWRDIAEQQATFVRRELTRLHGSDTKVDTSVEEGDLVEVSVEAKELTDLRCLKGLAQLRRLRLHSRLQGKVNLQPLRGLPLVKLSLENVQVETLAPLEGMALHSLMVLHGEPVTDLKPLAGMPLTALHMDVSAVTDWTPLQTMKNLKTLTLVSRKPIRVGHLDGLSIGSLDLLRAPLIGDLSPLKKLPLQHLYWDIDPHRGDIELLRDISTLQTINFKKAKEVLKEADAKQAEFKKWCDDVAKLSAKEQAEKVAAKLKELNPDMTAVTTPTIKDDKVVGVHFTNTQGVTDMSPVRALPALRELAVGGAFGEAGPHGTKNSWTNLYQVRGLQLESLRVGNGETTDLSPLKEMKSLSRLNFRGNKVADLAPLRVLPLKELELYGNPVADLSPLQGMPLEWLICTVTPVRDLSPLKDMPLQTLHVNATLVKDLSILRSMPLKDLGCDFVPWRDSEVLRSIKTLETVNGKPAKEFHAWADWEDSVRAAPPPKQIEMLKAKLKEIHGPGFTETTWPTYNKDGAITEVHVYSEKLTDISPLRAFRDVDTFFLGSLIGHGRKSSLFDISPLQGLKVKKLSLYNTSVTDIAFLRELPLKWLNLSYTGVKDLKPLAGMPLELLSVRSSPVTDLAALRGMPLVEFDCYGTQVTSLEPLSKSKLEKLNVSYTEKLVSLAGLEKLPLKQLEFVGSGVTNLEPVRTCPLESLVFAHNGISDLMPLQNMKTLRRLHNHSGYCVDLSPLQGLSLEDVYVHPGVRNLFALQGMPIKKLSCKFNRFRDYEVVKSLTQLEQIRPYAHIDSSPYIPVAEFWKTVEKERAEFETRAADIRKLQAEKQADEVMKWLAEVNKGFDGKLIGAKVQNSKVVALTLFATQLTDISPISSLTELEYLGCGGDWKKPGPTSTLADLWPLHHLDKLNALDCQHSSVTDLTPLRGLNLTSLNIAGNLVSDLTPLQGMKLNFLHAAFTQVENLKPLRGMPLVNIALQGSKASDLTPLLDSPIKDFSCNFVPERDAPTLRQLKSLETINGKKAAEVLK